LANPLNWRPILPEKKHDNCGQTGVLVFQGYASASTPKVKPFGLCEFGYANYKNFHSIFFKSNVQISLLLDRNFRFHYNPVRSITHHKDSISQKSRFNQVMCISRTANFLSCQKSKSTHHSFTRVRL
jgi:hypothetical protein